MPASAWSGTMDGKCGWCGRDDNEPCPVCGTTCEDCCTQMEHKPRWMNMPKDNVEAWNRECFHGGGAA